MSAVLSFDGADCLPLVSKPEDQERLLRAADYLADKLTTRQRLVLVALLCRGTPADIRSSLIRLCVLFRAGNHRDILDFLSPDPVAKALGMVQVIPIDEVRNLYHRLKATEPDAEELKAEEKMLDCLLEGDPCMELITHFKADLATRLKRLFVIHRTRLGEAAAIRAGKRCMVSSAEYDDTRFKPRHWQAYVDGFADHGVYPPAFLKECVRRYRSVPWPESCRQLIPGFTIPSSPVPVRLRSLDAILTELVEGGLRPEGVARLALNASAFSVRGLYIPRCLWLELAWSLLDGRNRTGELVSDLSGFSTRLSVSAVPQAEVLI